MNDRKRTVWLALLVVLSLILGGCGGAPQSAARDSGGPGGRSGSASSPSPAPAAEVPAGTPWAGSVSFLDTAENPGDEAAAPTADRKIIQNAEVELSVRDVDEALTSITDALTRSGGYVQENRVTGTREQGRRVAMTLRVPAGNFDPLLDLLRELGEVQSLRQWTNDVTEEYLDLEARIETGEAHLAQLNRLYERSGTISEMIELEREIARVTAELESLKGRYNFLANQVAFSTVSVSMYEPGVPAPARSPQSLGERMRDSFLFSWNATIHFAEGLLVALVGLIPGLLFLAVLVGIVGGVIWLIVRVRRGRGGPPGGGSRGEPAARPLYSPPGADTAGDRPGGGAGAGQAEG
ncbi:DUF4349 domain-containing protein [Symbiobacterium thermophilum]|uniref:DUF4349 domain-containing protein n=1 Tax=Symbiobacterium thermophilum TaxID=2734 RepID=A0A953LL09_SYMTR|nr:DUF4349 domain-containing protein [Symbiobacterium thermophilum]MBY6277627.1 hypothetical protein [Symbiobacterium thermophilum]